MLCLTVPTDPSWIAHAVRDLPAVLVDHAHCEMKAAANALSLAARHPDDLRLVQALSELAKEEIDHFQRVVRFLEARGLALGTPPVDAYAKELRKATNTLPVLDVPNHHLVDRLLVGALIEARSCERFQLLCEALEGGPEPELYAFYRELFACEARHFRTYVDLAVSAAGGDRETVTRRLAAMADHEGAVVSRLEEEELRATVHG